MSKNLGGTDGDQGQDIAMTLATIAYCADIEGNLKKYAPGWSLAWLPDQEVNANFAYIAYNGGQYCVAIRGSVLNFSWAAFYDWFEQDFNVLIQVDWNYPSSDKAPKISLGASYGLTDLISLVSTINGKKVRLLDFLMQNAVGRNTSIAVVGHSLGGCLATVLAPWLNYQMTAANKSVPDFPVFTFAAPTAGNRAFAEAFDATFQSSWRYYNEIDIVPMASSSIRDMGNLYSPKPEASEIYVTYKGNKITLQEAIIAFGDIVKLSEELYGSYYSQTNLERGSESLNGSKMLCPPSTIDPLVGWFDQAGCQHSTSTYLKYLGAPEFICPEAP